MKLSYNGWTASANAKDFGGLDNRAVGGVKMLPGVRRGDVATVLFYVAEQFHNRVERLAHPGCWGHAYRQNRNANNLSCHASATAIDLNAPHHPNGKRGTFSKAQVATIRKILAEVGGIVRWGGDFTGTPDEMHFEIVASPATVAMVAARLNRVGSPITTLPAPAPAPEEFLMALSDTQQRDLYNAVDFLKKRTEARDVQRFQRVNEAGQVVVCGPNDQGAEPTRSSDALDAVYAARQIEDLRGQVLRLEATVASLRK